MKTIFQFSCGLLLAVFAASPAQAGLMHNAGTTPGQAYLDYADFYPWVVPLTYEENGSLFFSSSAVVIAPGVAITSAHGILSVDSSPSSLYDGYAISFTQNFFTDPQPWIFSYDAVVHPDYDDVRNGPDLALLFFEEQFEVTPIDLYTGPHSVGTAYDLAGFGRYGTPSTGLVGLDGNVRAGTNLLTATGAFSGQYLQARFRSPGESTFQELGILGTPGDSGGGWFLDVNGEIQLAAISSLWTGDPNYGASTFATPFTPETLAWINSEIDSHAVPEPSSAALLLAGGAVGAFRRRKRKSV